MKYRMLCTSVCAQLAVIAMFFLGVIYPATSSILTDLTAHAIAREDSQTSHANFGTTLL
jgi:hypothetical protein